MSVAGIAATGPARAAAATTCPVLTAGGGLPAGLPTTGQNWSGCNLQGLRLYRVDISNDNMSGANLQDAFLNTVSGGGDNFTGADLTNALLSYTTLSGINLTGANLQGLAGSAMKFTGGDMTGADILTSANLNGATLDSANFSQANLTVATLNGASLGGITWFDTTCPDGTNSAAHSPNSQNCASNIDDRAPTAHPTVTGTIVNGWYRQATVTWNWTESSGTINTAKCPASTTSTTQGKPAKITTTCANTVGATGKATVSVNIENKGPAVAVTGVTPGRAYPAGHVPVPGCRTTDVLSGVAKAATLSVASAGWQHGVGAFTATCSGAADKAGIAQAAAVRVKYTVAYGLSGFAAPKNKATVARSARHFRVSCKLAGLTGGLAAKFAASGRVRVTLTGPGITPVTVTAAWQPKSGTFTASLPIPAKVKTGKTYQLTVKENPGPGWLTAPVTGKAVNPQTIQFRV